MRSVLSSEDLQTKREFQDLSYRLLKAREDIVPYFSSRPDVQKDITKSLELSSTLLSKVQSLDSSNVEILRSVCGHLEQLVGLISKSLELVPSKDRGNMPKYVRYLNKIVAKLKDKEEMINKRGFSRYVA